MSETQDIAKEALAAKLSPVDLHTATAAAEQLDAVVARLSEAEIKQIAEAVADRVMASQAHKIQPQQKEALRNRIASAAYQIGLGVAGSAVWSLLAYLANVWGYADSDNPEVTEHKASAAAKRDAIASNLSDDLRPEFASLFDGTGAFLVNSLIAFRIQDAATASSELGAVANDIREGDEQTTSAVTGREVAIMLTQELFARMKSAANQKVSQRVRSSGSSLLALADRPPDDIR